MFNPKSVFKYLPIVLDHQLGNVIYRKSLIPTDIISPIKLCADSKHIGAYCIIDVNEIPSLFAIPMDFEGFAFESFLDEAINDCHLMTDTISIDVGESEYYIVVMEPDDILCFQFSLAIIISGDCGMLFGNLWVLADSIYCCAGGKYDFALEGLQ